MPQDYIIRLLQQLGALLATISGKRVAGDLDGAEAEIAAACERQTGLPFVVVKQASPQTLGELLAMGGALQVPRTLTLVELLREEGRLCEQRGNPPAAALAYTQAAELLRPVLGTLQGEEAEHFSARWAELETKRRDLGGS